MITTSQVPSLSTLTVQSCRPLNKWSVWRPLITQTCLLEGNEAVRAHEGRNICWDLPILKFCFELLPLCV